MNPASSFSVVPVDRLELSHSSWEWPFAQARRRQIDAHFGKLQRDKPALWNGRVLMLRDFSIDDRVFRGRTFETDYASLLAWRDWDFPDPTVKNSFAMGALRGSDGGFILGEMGPHTANAGKITSPPERRIPATSKARASISSAAWCGKCRRKPDSRLTTSR